MVLLDILPEDKTFSSIKYKLLVFYFLYKINVIYNGNGKKDHNYTKRISGVPQSALGKELASKNRTQK